MWSRRFFLIPVIAGLMMALPARSQPDESSNLTFDVATFRAAKAGTQGGFIKALPGGEQYSAHNIPVKLMISLMYRIPMRQIQGGPDWINSEGYDVEAKTDHPYGIDDLKAMYRNLLVERLHLKFHNETREGNVYGLTVDPAGVKMKPNGSEQDFRIPVNMTGLGVAEGRRVPMPYLCWWLGQGLQHEERPVIDRSGLTGNYDFTLTFAPDLPADFAKDTLPAGFEDRPTLVNAVREQLGLKLTPQKGPVTWFVIDHIERPTDN